MIVMDDELACFLPKSGSSTTSIGYIAEMMIVKANIEQEDESETSINETEDVEDTLDIEEIIETNPPSPIIRYNYQLDEVGFLFFKLLQIVKNKVLKRKAKVEDKSKDKLVPSNKTLVYDQISEDIHEKLEKYTLEEKENVIEEEMKLMKLFFTNWIQIVTRRSNLSGLRVLKQNLVKEFNMTCSLELMELGRQIKKILNSAQ